MAKKKKTTKRTAAKKKPEEIPNFVVAAVVKRYIQEQGVRVSGDFVEALNKNVHRSLKWALKRCKGNKRSTVRPIDAL
jgi:histone H3/H4